MFKNKFCKHDSLISITYDDIITAIQCNEKTINKDTVKKVYNELIQTALKDARFELNRNIEDILKRV